MVTYTADHIASIIGAKQHGNSASKSISYLLIDSRKLVFPNTTLFFAIKTSTGDGHAFIDDLYHAGVRCFVVAHVPDLQI